MPIDFVSQLVSAAIRALGLGLIAVAGLLLFRIRSSAARHVTWVVVLAGMLIQIPLGLVAPTVSLKVLPVRPVPIQPRVIGPARISVGTVQTFAPAINTRTESKDKWMSLRTALTCVYLAISMLLFVRLVLGSWGLRGILRDAKPIPNLGPGVFESAAFVVPGSVGFFRAGIFLPQAWREWDAVKLRSVLGHERAHIRRQDWLIRVASHVNVCIFWFHPLAWWMERELARLAEEACDDLALSEMGDKEAYAATLISIAQTAAAGGSVLNWRIIPMAKESNVTRRVNRILNRELPVSKPFGRLAWVTLFACSLPVIYLSAVVKLASANQDSTVLEKIAVPAFPAGAARQLFVPEQKSSMSPSAQMPPNGPLSTPPPRTPSQRQDPPITMCLLIDSSGSMHDKRAGVRAATLALVRASKPDDEVCIVNFNDEVSSDLPRGEDFTSDIREMEGALTHIDSRGGTAMRDAIGTLIDHVERTAHHDRKVLVLVTEGNDNASTVTQEQLLVKLKNSGVRVYCIGLLSKDERRETRAARLALGQLSEASGGLVYYPGNLAEVESISPEIASEVRNR